MNAVERHHVERVAQIGCVVCRRVFECFTPAEIHHVAEGSAPRSWFAIAPLCPIHHDEHRAGTGFHGMGTDRFCAAFRVPGGTEYGLLVWVNEDLALMDLGRLVTT